MKLARSEAMLSRRKTGKTAIMHRLYNIFFHQNITHFSVSKKALLHKGIIIEKTITTHSRYNALFTLKKSVIG
jgi:hypothetical protein